MTEGRHARDIPKQLPSKKKRFYRLRELSLSKVGYDISAYFEAGPMPFCFFPKEIPGQVALESFIEWCRALHALDDELVDAFDKQLHYQDKNQDGTREVEDATRLCFATVVCQNDQSLKIGMFVKGRYGWTVSTAERLQCYAYTPCTIVFVVPAGCQTSEACSPVCNMKVHRIIAIQSSEISHHSEDLISSPKVDSSDAASPTPLGSNTFLPPTGSVSKEDDEQQEGVTKKRGGSISPTLSWSVAKQAGDTTIKASTPADRATNLAEKGGTARSRNGYADTARIRSHLDKDVLPSKGGLSQGETEVGSKQRLDGIISLCEHHVPQASQAPENLSITPRGELQQSTGQSRPRESSVGPYSRIDESSKPFGSDGALFP